MFVMGEVIVVTANENHRAGTHKNTAQSDQDIELFAIQNVVTMHTDLLER